MTDVNQLITDHLDIWTSATEKKSSAGRGNGGSVSLYGVAKLRKLILDLAVRGRLLPQIDDGEQGPSIPTSPKRKKISHPDERELDFVPPRNWTEARFGEFFSLEYGDNLPKKKRSESGEFPVYGSNGVVGTHKEACVHSPCIVVGRKGSAGALNLCLEDACWVTDVAYSCIPPASIDLHFAMMLFSTMGLDSLGKGIKPGLNRNEAYALPVAIPPLAEQRCIVTKVDELMVLCDALEQQAEDSLKAHQTVVKTCLATLSNSQSSEELTQNWTRIETHFDTLFTTEESVKALEEVILQLGVSGLLGTGNPADEDADSILKKIGKRNPKAKKGKRSGLRGQVSLNQSNGLDGELPRGWELVEFAELVEPSKPISYGVLVPGKDTDGGVPFVRIADLSIDSPAELPEKSISQKVDEQYARTRLEGGEILMGVVGSIGKLGVAPDSWRGANIARAVCRIVPAQELSKNFVLLLLRSRMMQERFRGDTRVLAQPTLNIGLIRSAPTPLPPLAEQHRIVERVEGLLKVSARLRSLIETSQSTSLLLANTLTSKIY